MKMASRLLLLSFSFSLRTHEAFFCFHFILLPLLGPRRGILLIVTSSRSFYVDVIDVTNPFFFYVYTSVEPKAMRRTGYASRG